MPFFVEFLIFVSLKRHTGTKQVSLSQLTKKERTKRARIKHTRIRLGVPQRRRTSSSSHLSLLIANTDFALRTRANLVRACPLGPLRRRRGEMGKHKRQNVIQKRQQKNFTALMKKKERKERRKNLKEHRAQLRENNFLGVFTSIAEYPRRQTLRNINCVMTNHYAIWTDLRYRLLSARMLAHASRKQSENS